MKTCRWRWIKNQKITKVILIHSLGAMDNSTNSMVIHQYLYFIERQKYQPHGGAGGKVRRSPKSEWDSAFFGDHERP